MSANLLIKLKNLILDAVITRIVDSNNYQVSFLGKNMDIKSINPYGFKSIAPIGSNVVVFSSKGRLDNAKALPISDAKDIINASGAVAGESIVYNEISGDYIILKNSGIVIIKSNSVNIAEGSKGVARLDDTVTGQVVIPGGSSAGTYPVTLGKIATASSKVVSG